MQVLAPRPLIVYVSFNADNEIELLANLTAQTALTCGWTPIRKKNCKLQDAGLRRYFLSKSET